MRANHTGLMFQEAALFPWLTARGNVELALKLAGVGRDERRARTDELLEMVHLGDFAKKRPHELSGGMRQRVALARALAQDAEVLLMDEPFGALDAMTRDRLHDELETVWRETRKTVIFVTHNVREAVRLGDRVVLLASRPGPRRRDLPGRHPAAAPHRLDRGRDARRHDHRPPAGGGRPMAVDVDDRASSSRELHVEAEPRAQAVARGLAEAARRRDLRRRVAGRRVDRAGSRSTSSRRRSPSSTRSSTTSATLSGAVVRHDAPRPRSASRSRS